jgi:hypothetical protein
MGVCILSKSLLRKVERVPNVPWGKRGGGVGYVVKDKRMSIE